MAEPKCPSCRVSGISNIVSTSSKEQSTSGKAWFEVAHCRECGHIYGVFPKYLSGCGAPDKKFFLKLLTISKGYDPDDLNL